MKTTRPATQEDLKKGFPKCKRFLALDRYTVQETQFRNMYTWIVLLDGEPLFNSMIEIDY